MQEKPRDWHNFLQYLLIEQHWHGSQHTNGRTDISSALFASIHLSCTISFTTALHLRPAARLLWVENRHKRHILIYLTLRLQVYSAIKATDKRQQAAI